MPHRLHLCNRPDGPAFYVGALRSRPLTFAQLLQHALSVFDVWLAANTQRTRLFNRVAATFVHDGEKFTVARLRKEEFLISEGVSGPLPLRAVYSVVLTALEEEGEANTLSSALAAAVEMHAGAMRCWTSAQARETLRSFADACGSEDGQIMGARFLDLTRVLGATLTRPVTKAELKYARELAEELFGATGVETNGLLATFLPPWLKTEEGLPLAFCIRLAYGMDRAAASTLNGRMAEHFEVMSVLGVTLRSVALFLDGALEAGADGPEGSTKKAPTPAPAAAPTPRAGAAPAVRPPAAVEPPPRAGTAGAPARPPPPAGGHDAERPPTVEALVALYGAGPGRALLGWLFGAFFDARAPGDLVVFVADAARGDEGLQGVCADVFAEAPPLWSGRFASAARARGLRAYETPLSCGARRVCLHERVGHPPVAVANVRPKVPLPANLGTRSTCYLPRGGDLLSVEPPVSSVVRGLADMICLYGEAVGHGADALAKLVRVRLIYRSLRVFLERSKLRLLLDGEQTDRVHFTDYDRAFSLAPSSRGGGNAAHPTVRLTAVRDVPFSALMVKGALLCDLSDADATSAAAHGPRWAKTVKIALDAAQTKA